MAQVIIEFDLYLIYGRILEDVIVDVTLEYSIDAILTKKQLNNSTVAISSIKFTGDSLEYIETSPFDKVDILKGVKNYFEHENIRIDELLEAMPEADYEKIKHLI